jgi:hypothetical protein
LLSYGFEETAGAQLHDASGLGNDATFKGAKRATGRHGRALTFDGKHVVTLPAAATADIARVFTLEAWVKPQSTPAKRSAVLFGPGGAFALFAGDASARPGSIPAASVKSKLKPLASRRWTHLAVTYDGRRVTFFVNGTTREQRTYGSAAAASRAGTALLGGTGARGQSFKGELDDVRMYSRALTPAEVQADMNAVI